MTNRSRLRTTRRWLCPLSTVLLASTTPLTAAPQGFDIGRCSWNATDILIAEDAGALDGKFKALEVWRGNLQVGARLSVPQMEDMALTMMRQVRRAEPNNKPRRVITGNRVLLFLRREAGAFLSANQVVPHEFLSHEGEEQKPKVYDLTTSVVWLEKGEAFARTGHRAAKTAMRPLGLRESELRQLVLEFLQERGAVTALARIRPRARSRAALDQFRKTASEPARNAVYSKLAGAGLTRRRLLPLMLKDLGQSSSHSRIAIILRKLQKHQASEIFCEVLRADLKGWHRDASHGSRNKTGSEKTATRKPVPRRAAPKRTVTKKSAAGPARSPTMLQDRQGRREHRLGCCLYGLWKSGGTFNPKLIRSIQGLKGGTNQRIPEQARRICEDLLEATERHRGG